MKIYWSMNSVPELDGLDRKEKRKRYREIYKHGRTRIGALPWVYTILTGVVIGALAISFGMTGVLVNATIGGLMALAVIVFVQAPAIEHGRAWYRDHYGPA